MDHSAISGILLTLLDNGVGLCLWKNGTLRAVWGRASEKKASKNNLLPHLGEEEESRGAPQHQLLVDVMIGFDQVCSTNCQVPGAFHQRSHFWFIHQTVLL